MNVAIIGLGRVGATTASHLLELPDITRLSLISRDQDKSLGLKHDLAGTFPSSIRKIECGSFDLASSADVIVITSGEFGAPAGTSLWEVNKPIIENICEQLNPKATAKIVVITTPSDRNAKLVSDCLDLPTSQVFGFGGQLDVNRLQFVLSSAGYEIEKSKLAFIGEHGKRGIPIMPKDLESDEIIADSQGYFGKYLAKTNSSTYGTARELAFLVKALGKSESTILSVSYYESKYDLFVTWPCEISNEGLIRSIDLDILDSHREQLDQLIKIRQVEE